MLFSALVIWSFSLPKLLSLKQVKTFQTIENVVTFTFKFFSVKLFVFWLQKGVNNVKKWFSPKQIFWVKWITKRFLLIFRQNIEKSLNAMNCYYYYLSRVQRREVWRSTLLLIEEEEAITVIIIVIVVVVVVVVVLPSLVFICPNNLS